MQEKKTLFVGQIVAQYTLIGHFDLVSTTSRVRALQNLPSAQPAGKHYMVAHHIVVQHKLIEHCVQRLVSSTHFSKLLFSVLSTPRLSLVSFYVLLCT